ncbi:hypothetical protein THRCLA_20318 [Thraustotheca clavata]|uniref:Uncharacterized protein n=1 Tax=Thraustotheca clavata TaxID=74557 RepID=A0A1W0A8P4_9STRA|nr:hypothetical protein THRCLA_20318 [Thraustotheca clavata]
MCSTEKLTAPAFLSATPETIKKSLRRIQMSFLTSNKLPPRRALTCTIHSPASGSGSPYKTS